MARKHTVLRNTALSRTGEPFHPGRVGPMLESLSRAVPELVIETEDLRSVDLRDIARDPEVAAIAPVMPTKLIAPVDTGPGEAETAAWGISAVKADVSPFTGDGVVVSVLDTGIDASHAAFQGVDLIEKDFTESGNGDRNGHGTHCAGTIFGRDVDGTRIGVAPGVTNARIGKVLGDDGSGDSDMIYRAIQWAANNGANVVSMSLGFDFPGLVAELEKSGWPVELATSVALEGYRGNLRMFDALMELIQARTAFGGETIVVAAAGNESRREVDPEFEIAAGLPAAAEGVISVGALQKSDSGLKVADFSNTLPQVSAPGVGILSAQVGGGLHPLNGTSMACPHVAGVLALWVQAVRQGGFPDTESIAVAKLLANTRTDVIDPAVDSADRGAGIVTAPLDE